MGEANRAEPNVPLGFGIAKTKKVVLQAQPGAEERPRGRDEAYTDC